MKKMLFLLVALPLLLSAWACKQPSAGTEGGDNPLPPVVTEKYRISLNDNAKEVVIYAPTAVEFTDPVFTPPKDIEVTVTNQWNQPTGRLNVMLAGKDTDLFSVSPARITDLEPGESAKIVITVAGTDPRRPTSYRVDLLVGNEDMYQKLAVAYHVCTFGAVRCW